jgi:hypothetical protein
MIRNVLGFGIFIYVICLVCNTSATVDWTKGIAVQIKHAVVEVRDAQ